MTGGAPTGPAAAAGARRPAAEAPARGLPPRASCRPAYRADSPASAAALRRRGAPKGERNLQSIALVTRGGGKMRMRGNAHGQRDRGCAYKPLPIDIGTSVYTPARTHQCVRIATDRYAGQSQAFCSILLRPTTSRSTLWPTRQSVGSSCLRHGSKSTLGPALQSRRRGRAADARAGPQVINLDAAQFSSGRTAGTRGKAAAAIPARAGSRTQETAPCAARTNEPRTGPRRFQT